MNATRLNAQISALLIALVLTGCAAEERDYAKLTEFGHVSLAAEVPPGIDTIEITFIHEGSGTEVSMTVEANPSGITFIHKRLAAAFGGSAYLVSMKGFAGDPDPVGSAIAPCLIIPDQVTELVMPLSRHATDQGGTAKVKVIDNTAPTADFSFVVSSDSMGMLQVDTLDADGDDAGVIVSIDNQAVQAFDGGAGLQIGQQINVSTVIRVAIFDAYAATFYQLELLPGDDGSTLTGDIQISLAGDAELSDSYGLCSLAGNALEDCRMATFDNFQAFSVGTTYFSKCDNASSKAILNSACSSMKVKPAHICDGGSMQVSWVNAAGGSDSKTLLPEDTGSFDLKNLKSAEFQCDGAQGKCALKILSAANDCNFL